MAFLKDPKGPPLWEEDPGAKDVVHIDSEKVIHFPSILMDTGTSPEPVSQGQVPKELRGWSVPWPAVLSPRELGQGPRILPVAPCWPLDGTNS